MSGARLPRVLIVHAACQQRGGEDSVVESEIDLLRRHGHEVLEYRRHNDELSGMSRPQAALTTLWSSRAHADVADLLRSARPDIVHVHNTFPLISPSVYWACTQAGVPVVQTLHNFRLMCPQAMLLRQQKVCEDCVGAVPWRGVLRACYRGSALQSGVLAASLQLHRAIGTYRRHVSRYIALNEFCRRKFIEGGLPAERISVKPNFIDSAPDGHVAGERAGALFVGRLSEEKGVGLLAEARRLAPDLAWAGVVGGGPLESEAASAFGPQLMLGARPLPEVLALMKRSACLVLPSIWYENFPRTIVEAFACGLPVVGSRLGAVAEIIEHGQTGLLFEPGDARALVQGLRWAQSHPQEMARMGERARQVFEERYSAETNYRQLRDIYAGELARLP